MKLTAVYNFLNQPASASDSVNIDRMLFGDETLHRFNQRIISKEDYVFDPAVRKVLDQYYDRLPETIVWWRANMHHNESIGYEEYLGWQRTTFYIR